MIVFILGTNPGDSIIFLSLFWLIILPMLLDGCFQLCSGEHPQLSQNFSIKTWSDRTQERRRSTVLNDNCIERQLRDDGNFRLSNRSNKLSVASHDDDHELATEFLVWN